MNRWLPEVWVGILLALAPRSWAGWSWGFSPTFGEKVMGKSLKKDRKFLKRNKDSKKPLALSICNWLLFDLGFDWFMMASTWGWLTHSMCQQQNFQQPYRWSQISTHSKPARTMRNTVAELLWDKSRASENEASGTVFDKWCLGAWTAPNWEPKWVPSKFGTKATILRLVLLKSETVWSSRHV